MVRYFRREGAGARESTGLSQEQLAVKLQFDEFSIIKVPMQDGEGFDPCIDLGKGIELLPGRSFDLFGSFKEWPGHSDIKMTGNLYSHFNMRQKQGGANSFSANFSSALEKTLEKPVEQTVHPRQESQQ